jgi:serine/threonine protein phosphatase PrpC
MTQQLHYLTIAATEAKAPGERRNQDAVYAQAWHNDKQIPCGLFVVADGVGGHKEGSLASQMTVETISEVLQPIWKNIPPEAPAREEYLKGHLYQAIVTAHRKILYHAQNHDIRMASTVTCALVFGTTAVIANVGDSRTYLLRHHHLEQLTTDHSVVAWLVREGKLTPEEAADHPYRNVIMHALGANEIPEIDLFCHLLQVGDLLLLCSDGIWGTLSNDHIEQIVSAAADMQTAVTDIMTTAQDHTDDLTLVMAQLTNK